MYKKPGVYIVFLLMVIPSCSNKTVFPISNKEQTGSVASAGRGKNIIWDQSSLQRLAPQAGRSIGYCGYPRMIRLHDKSLICVYEVAGGSIESIKSFDKGNSWSAPVVIALRQNGINMAVPEILELKDQSLLVSYNPRPSAIAEPSSHFGIRTKKSYDGGISWTDERLLYEAGAKFEDGCWEPAQIQLPSGEVQLFFSNEGIYTNSNEQDISIFRSYDNGLTWTTRPQIISFRAGKRDGMPVPVLSQTKKEILFSIEDNASGEFKPAIIRTTIAGNWNTVVGGTSNNRNAALAQPLHDTIYAGAPYLRQFKTGETILSYQGTEGRKRNWKLSCMFVALGNKNFQNFGHTSMPFIIPLNKQGLWNSLCVLEDDTVLALTSTNAFAMNATEVWMIKGRLTSDKTGK